jgi:hypothetical protein
MASQPHSELARQDLPAHPDLEQHPNSSPADEAFAEAPPVSDRLDARYEHRVG